jgi:hypothetical protein
MVASHRRLNELLMEGVSVLPQCDKHMCLKWRKMPPGWTKAQLDAAGEDGCWICSMNPDPAMAALGCAAPEEQYIIPLAADAERRSVRKRYQEVTSPPPTLEDLCACHRLVHTLRQRIMWGRWYTLLEAI